MSFELTGKLIEKLDLQQITDSFQKREFVVEKTENANGRKWEKNGNVSYFTNLEAWRIESADQSMNTNTPPPQTEVDIPPPPEEEDLPF